NQNSRVGNRGRLPAGHESLARLAEEVMQSGHVIRDAAKTDGVLNPRRQIARLGENCSDPFKIPGGNKRRSELAPNVDRLFDTIVGLRNVSEGCQGLFEPGLCLTICGSRKRLDAGATEITDSLFPLFAMKGMMRKLFDVFGDTVGALRFDRVNDASMQRSASLVKHATVGDFVRECVLEGVLGIRKEA